MLCVGLDPEPSKFPGAWKGDASRIYDFCAAIVDATKDLVSSFKPQIAYFAAHRAEDQLERLMAHMRRTAPNVPAGCVNGYGQDTPVLWTFNTVSQSGALVTAAWSRGVAWL